MSFANSPRFYTPRMIERRGLTDAQYEYLWSIGKNPHVDKQTARNWYVRSSQNDNFCTWLDTDGKSNELSRLTHTLATNNTDLAENNLILTETNRTLTAELTQAAATIANGYVALTNSMAQTAAYSNLYVIVSAQATAAQAKIADEIADLQAKIEKYKEYQTKYPLLKSIFAAMITDAENRIKILQALTGSNT